MRVSPASLTNCYWEVQKVILQQYSTAISITWLFFNHLHSIHHFTTVKTSLHYSNGSNWPHSAIAAAVLDSGMNHSIGSFLMRWLNNCVYRLQASVCVYFEHSLQCGIVTDTFYCFKKTTVVEVFGICFWKLSWIEKKTVA